MANAKQDRSWISRIGLQAIIAMVALGAMLIPTLIGGRPGQAPQTGPIYRVLYTFTGGADGADPSASVILDPTRNLLVGTTIGGYGEVFGVNRATRQETTLYSFTGGADGGYGYNGGYPVAGVIRDASGNLYGATTGGGADGNGVVFELSPTGQETVLYSFSGGADGANPYGRLIRDASGNLYGTTASGGDPSDCGGHGCGVVFRLSPTGQETVLHSFTGGADGGNPYAGLIHDSSGNLYGSTSLGGNGSCSTFLGVGCGVVFKLSRTGQETVLYTFTGPDGAGPLAGLIRDSSGNLYGTSISGGAYGYWGVVFELSPTGQETVLYSFTGGADGGLPEAGLIRDASGNLYGTTGVGGVENPCGYNGRGVVFKLSPTGQETVLHSFTDGTDGALPVADLILDSAGNLYGTTLSGGDQSGHCWSQGYKGCGVVFELTP